MIIAKMFVVLALSMWVYNLFRILKTDTKVRAAGFKPPPISIVLKVITVLAIAIHIIWLSRLNDYGSSDTDVSVRSDSILPER